MVPAKGRYDRIALIHAVYGLAWSIFAIGLGLPSVVAIPLVALAVAMLPIAVRRLSRGDASVQPDGVATGRAILRINVATAAAVVVALLGLHGRATEAHVVGAVLAIMAVHFVPLWRLLHRGSLLVMAAGLALAALLTLSPLPTHVAAAVAAVAFLANSGRLLRNEIAMPRA